MLAEKFVLMERIITGIWPPSEGKATPPPSVPPQRHRQRLGNGFDDHCFCHSGGLLSRLSWSREPPHLSFPLVMRSGLSSTEADSGVEKKVCPHKSASPIG